MDKYIKVSDVLELINKVSKEVNQDYEDKKISMGSNIAMIGVLETLKKEINK